VTVADGVDRAPLTMRGQLPSGPEFAFSMTKGMIALRAADRICVAHPKWMTAEQALQLADQLKEVARV